MGPSTSYSSNPFGPSDRDSAYEQDRASEMSRPSYQGSLGKAEGQKSSSLLQKAKAKFKTGRSKSKDWTEAENRPLNTSPMGQQAQSKPGKAAQSGHANGHANGQQNGQEQRPAPEQVQQHLKDSMEAFFADVSEVKVRPA